MPFKFLKYLQPTHYFRLKTKSNLTVFPKAKSLPPDVLIQLKRDQDYQSQLACDYDLSWQAVQNGYIGNSPVFSDFEPLTVYDNYHFIRKYFHKSWVFYVFIVRVLSFHNPFLEAKAWFKSRRVRRSQGIYEPVTYSDYDEFKSPLINTNPKVSVVIPTLNRYTYLKDVLKDLEGQDYTNIEVIVVDQSEPYNSEFYSGFNLQINVIRQEEKALWLARNTAIKNSKGTLIALSEDDVRIKPDWISSHLRCLDYFDADVSAGVFYPEGQQIPMNRSYFAIASQFATGNAMLYKNVFKKVGLFDRQFEKQRMGDGEFGMRLYLDDIKSISNPLASCIDVKAGTGGLREMGSWDAFRPSHYFAPRPIPSVLYYFIRYFGSKAARLALLRNVPLSVFPYQFKKNKPLLILGVFLTIIMLPLVFYQVIKSWRLASKKINEGPLIESIS